MSIVYIYSLTDVKCGYTDDDDDDCNKMKILTQHSHRLCNWDEWLFDAGRLISAQYHKCYSDRPHDDRTLVGVRWNRTNTIDHSPRNRIRSNWAIRRSLLPVRNKCKMNSKSIDENKSIVCRAITSSKKIVACRDDNRAHLRCVTIWTSQFGPVPMWMLR